MTFVKNDDFQALILHEIIVNRIRKYEANFYVLDEKNADRSYDHTIYTLSIIIGEYYNKPIYELTDFIDEMIFPLVKHGYYAGPHLSPIYVDAFIEELGQKVSGALFWREIKGR